jgi:cytochrome c556
MTRLAPLALPAILILAACGGPQTPGAKAAKERHHNFEALGKAFKGIGDELKKDAPDTAKIKESAGTIDRLAPQLKSWFPAGSGPQDGVKTHALAVVWSQPDEFDRAAKRLGDAAAQLNNAAQSGDLAAIRGTVQPLGAACKNCHDHFREKD